MSTHKSKPRKRSQRKTAHVSTPKSTSEYAAAASAEDSESSGDESVGKKKSTSASVRVKKTAMIRLFCALVGVKESAFHVDIDASESVHGLKKEITKEKQKIS